MRILLCLLIMLTLQTRWGLLFAALLSWQHFEQGMVGFLLLGGTLAIMVLAGKKPADLNALKWTGAVLLTMVAGKGLLALHFHLSHLQMGGDRYSYTKVYLPIWIKAWTDDWPSILFSLFGTGWLILIARYRKIWFIFPAVLVAFVLLMAIGDKTRVGTIVLFPVTMYVIFMNEEFWGFLNARWICALLILHLATPVCFFWLKAHGSLWRYSQVLVTNFIDSSQSFRNLDSWKPFVDENPPPTIFIKADYAPKTFAAAVLPSQIGRIEGTTRVATAGEAGFLTYGPYIILPPGSYLAKIFYSAEADSSGQTTGTWDVALPPPAAKEISRGELPPGSNRIHEIRFAIDRDVRIEIRTRATGKGRLTVEKVEIHPVSN